MYLLYILQCVDGSLYTGITNNLELRLRTHQSGKGSKYVRARLPFKVVYKEVCKDRSMAMKRELEVKKLKRAEKLALL